MGSIQRNVHRNKVADHIGYMKPNRIKFEENPVGSYINKLTNKKRKKKKK